MFSRLASIARGFVLLLGAPLISSATCSAAAAWSGVLRDAAGNPLDNAEIHLQATDGSHRYSVTTTATGQFTFVALSAGSYTLTATALGKIWTATEAVEIKERTALLSSLQLSAGGRELHIIVAKGAPKDAAKDAVSPQASGGEHLSTGEVSSLPLNERDFSKLLLLATGTMTDTNGAANFTQQFAVNGQRGSAAVFAMDGADTTDPELGGATFSNFNVDAIQEVQSSSGVIPAEIGHGAAGFTNVVTKSGTNLIHGSAFEFLRNAALDARNFFDHPSAINPRRIPPFARNEFGATIGGPVVLPHLYDGRDKTFFFGEYQGFRQVLGTTQVIPVPTAAERQGIDTTTFPGDTLTIPVNAAVVPVLNGYPMPNEPAGAFGDRTYAASSKVRTVTDQFSIRVDHQISNKASLLTRFSLNQVTGPLTNPDQTVLDPSFGIPFYDHQRNVGAKYTRTLSPHMTSETS